MASHSNESLTNAVCADDCSVLNSRKGDDDSRTDKNGATQKMETVRRCSYMLPKKRRLCRMLVKPGKMFCGEHEIFNPDNKERVVCPKDPGHTVNKSELAFHLTKRCNSRLPTEPWVVKNINVVEPNRREADCETETAFEERIVRVATIVELAYGDIASSVSDEVKTTSVIEEYIRSQKNINATRLKHLRQLSSIIGYLNVNGLLKNDENHCLMDIGAGKAQLAYWTSKVAPKCRSLLIERSGVRFKFENKACREDPALHFTRLRCPVEDLDLSKVDTLKDVTSLSAVCKHLCGRATDYGLRCLRNAVNSGINFKGFALVPCCHHKSTFAEYAGRSFLAKYELDNALDFHALCYMAAWAVSSIPMKEGVARNDCAGCKVTSVQPHLKEVEGGVFRAVVADRETTGRKAKVLLECGRAEYLRSMGYKVSIHRYIDYETSPENLIIVGMKSD